MQLILDPDNFFKKRAEGCDFRLPALIVLLTGIISGIGTTLLIVGLSSAVGGSIKAVVWIVALISALIALLEPFAIWGILSTILLVSLIFVEPDGDFRTLIALLGWGMLPRLFASITATTVLAFFIFHIPADASAQQVAILQSNLQGGSIRLLIELVKMLALLWSGMLWTFAIQHTYELDLNHAAVLAYIPVVAYILVSSYVLF